MPSHKHQHLFRVWAVLHYLEEHKNDPESCKLFDIQTYLRTNWGAAKDLMDEDMAYADVLIAQNPLDVVDRVVLFAKFDDALAGGVPFRGSLGSRLGGLKPGQAPRPEFAAQRVQRGDAVAESLGRLLGRESLGQVGAQRLVLALRGTLRVQKELGARSILGFVCFTHTP